MKNPLLGLRIESVDDLIVARNNRRSVCTLSKCAAVYPHNVTPAAWLLCQSAERVHRLIADGLYLYEKPKKKAFFKKPSTKKVKTSK